MHCYLKLNGSFRLAGTAGLNTFRFTGRLNSKMLAPAEIGLGKRGRSGRERLEEPLRAGVGPRLCLLLRTGDAGRTPMRVTGGSRSVD